MIVKNAKNGSDFGNVYVNKIGRISDVREFLIAPKTELKLAKTWINCSSCVNKLPERV